MSKNEQKKVEKKVLREKMQLLRHSVSKEMKNETEHVLSQQIIKSSAFNLADHVLAYNAKGDELDLKDVYETALKQGKTLCFPRSEEGDHYHFAEVTDIKADQELATFNVLEPKGDCPRFLAEDASYDKTVIVVPALVYDREGYRLGYGRGIYDGLLSDYHGYSIGVGYSFQEIEILPREPWDRRLSGLQLA